MEGAVDFRLIHDTPTLPTIDVSVEPLSFTFGLIADTHPGLDDAGIDLTDADIKHRVTYFVITYRACH